MQLWLFGEPEVAVIQVSVSIAQSVLHHHKLSQSVLGISNKPTICFEWFSKCREGKKKKTTPKKTPKNKTILSFRNVDPSQQPQPPLCLGLMELNISTKCSTGKMLFVSRGKKI